MQVSIGAPEVVSINLLQLIFSGKKKKKKRCLTQVRTYQSMKHSIAPGRDIRRGAGATDGLFILFTGFCVVVTDSSEKLNRTQILAYKPHRNYASKFDPLTPLSLKNRSHVDAISMATHSMLPSRYSSLLLLSWISIHLLGIWELEEL